MEILTTVNAPPELVEPLQLLGFEVVARDDLSNFLVTTGRMRAIEWAMRDLQAAAQNVLDALAALPVERS